MRQQRLARIWLWGPRLVVALATATGPATGVAQERRVAELNKRAMKAYHNLDINRAGAMLEEALRLASGGRVKSRTLARTHLNLGIVYVGGLGEPDSAMPYFIQALCLDSKIRADRHTRTPAIRAIYKRAKSEVKAGACEDFASSANGVSSDSDLPSDAGQMESFGRILHRPPKGQTPNTPLPLYVELGPLPEARHIYLYYRGLGMDGFRRVEMRKLGRGFGYQIGCEDVWEPRVRYYIRVVGPDGEELEVAGARDSALEVPVLERLSSPAPAFPGRKPPKRCADEECPPGVACQQAGGLAGAGQPCNTSAECQRGMFCSDNLCAVGQEPQRRDVEQPEARGRFFVRAGPTLGMVWMSAGMVADRGPPVDARGQLTVPVYTTDIRREMLGEMSQFVETLGASYASPWVPDADSRQGDGKSFGSVISGECPADGTVTSPTSNDPRLRYPSRYCLRVAAPGIVPVMALRTEVGYWVTSRLALEGVFRFQFETSQAPDSTLANMLFGLRAEYLLSKPKSDGLLLTVLVGSTFGQIQARAPGGGPRPFAISGLHGVHLGLSARYRLGRSFAFHLTPEVDLQLPIFMLAIDTTAGLELTF